MTAEYSIRAIVQRALIYAGALAGGIAAFWWLDAQGADVFEAFTMAVLIVGLVLVGLWLLREGWREATDLRALTKDRRGDPVPGEWVAVSGTAVALGEPIRAALSDRPALASSYKLFEQFRPGTRPGSSTRTKQLRLRNEGHRLAPTGIDTGTRVVPLRALPDLVDLERSEIGAAAPGFSESVIQVPHLAPKYALRAHLAAQASDRLSADWRYRVAEETEGLVRREWVLAPGDKVTVFGRWNGGALTPTPSRPRGLPVYAGTAEEAAQRLKAGGRIFLGLAVLPLAAVAWLVWGYVG